MSDTILRLGLWTLILVLALFVITEAYHDESWVEMVPHTMLQQVLVVAVLVIVAGVILKMLGKGASAVSKNRCRVCREPIASGAIYCRQHLRSILHEEDDRSHMSHPRRR